MRRKVLQGFANTLCQMFAGCYRYADDDRLARLGGGDVRIDCLAGRATLNGHPIETLYIVGHLSAWLKRALASAGIPVASIIRAELVAPCTVEPFLDGTRRLWSVWYTCTSEIATDEVIYRGAVTEPFGTSAQIGPDGR